MTATLVILPSVLLGARPYRPLAERFGARGRVATVADTADATTPSAVAERYRRAAPDAPVTWVAHSNAGMYLPQLLHDRPGDAGVLLDATVPGAPPHVSADGEWLATLTGLADGDGVLPPWAEWWGTEQIEELVPDQALMPLLTDGAPRLPVGYFTAAVAVPAAWQGAPLGYVAYDGPYTGVRDAMAEEGRPTRHVTGGHLALLVDPEPTVDAVLAVEEQLLRRR
ncbi:hypothetical protein [Streptomyces lonarensis]|uniref:Alpha/beta hydrolase n=1 Tax=Streptomyces lonarensis TaxID=700599 RepID=A0A7X6CZP1_9ACTN|nr:hypothetical protein [Streptomyces lonarensis]NJQ05404.1 hypothetical protein [Streptomyces lonarensis]